MMDIKRIPILSLSSIISLTDFLSELPLPNFQPEPNNDSLWHNDEVYNEATKILNSKNKPFFESLTKALATTSTDEIVLKESCCDEKMGVEDVPTIFKQMVKHDADKFKKKVGFEQFFKNDETKVDTNVHKVKDKSKKKKKKNKESKNEKESSKSLNSNSIETKAPSSITSITESTYKVTTRINGTRLTIKKLKSDPIEEIQPSATTNIIKSSPNLKESVNVNLSQESVKSCEDIKPKIEDIDKTEPVKSDIADENYQFMNLQPTIDTTTATGPTNMFENKKLFDTDMNLDVQTGSEEVNDPNSNALSVHESVVGVKDTILSGLGEIPPDDSGGNNSPVPEENNEHFGLAAYLTKSDHNLNSSQNNQENNQPGSCLSMAPNSVDKVSEASLLDSSQLNGGPNSALSSLDQQNPDSVHYYNRKQRTRNKEVENLKKWQIKDKGIPQNDPLDCTTVGPGERVKTRTRRCVRRHEREDGSSISETSYQTTNDISPHIQDHIAQTHLLSLKSESSFDDKQSPHITNHHQQQQPHQSPVSSVHEPTPSIGQIQQPASSISQKDDNDSAQIFNEHIVQTPTNDDDIQHDVHDYQIDDAAVDIIIEPQQVTVTTSVLDEQTNDTVVDDICDNYDVLDSYNITPNVTDVPTVPSPTHSEENINLPKINPRTNIFTPNSNTFKGKKIPNRTRNRLSSRASSLENYSNYEANSTSVLKAELVDLSDDEMKQYNEEKTTKCSKNNKTNKKKTKKAKVPSMKTNATTDNRLQHLLASREAQNLITNRQRIYRGSQYNSNMNPVVLITPLYINNKKETANDHDECDGDDDDETCSNYTIPFTFESEQALISYNNSSNPNNKQKRRCDNLKARFTFFLNAILRGLEELNLLDIASHNRTLCCDLEIEQNNQVDLTATLSRDTLEQLSYFVGKLKKNQIMHEIPAGKLIRLLMVLLINMCSSEHVPNDTKKRVQRWLQQQLINCLDSSLIALSIIVSPDMSRTIFLEDVIQNATDLFRTILRYLIYIVHDSHYSRSANPHDILLSIIANININKSFNQSEYLIQLQKRVQCGVNCLAEMLLQKPNRLTDEAVLKITSLGMSALSVANITELQLSMIPLLAALFSQYESIRKSIVADLLSIIIHNNYSTNKKPIKKYKINSEESIQITSAAILVLFQSVVQKPISSKKSNSNKSSLINTADNITTVDTSILYTLNSSVKYMQIFVQSFFKKVCLKGEDSCRQSLDNFLQDLFTTFNKPEWPASNFLLHCFGSTILQHLSDKSFPINNNNNNINNSPSSTTNSRTIAIDVLGTITAFICKETIVMKQNNSTQINLIDRIIDKLCGSSNLSDDQIHEIESMQHDDKLKLLKLIILHFLNSDSSDTTSMYARRYYIGLFLQELCSNNNKEIDETFKNALMSQLSTKPISLDTMDLPEASYEDVCFICRTCQANKDTTNFDAYLVRICKSLDENSVPVRTKSMRSLSLVLEEDCNLLTKSEIEKAVNKRFLDSSIAVREATVDLVGKFLLKKPDLINHYYPVLITRIADTGTSVRKRVIKVLWDICIAQSDFPHAADAYSKIMRRFYDEESIKKLVNEVFKSIWFVPISDPVKLQQRIFSIANVIQCISNDEKYNHNVMFQFISQLVKIECEHGQDVRSQRNFEKSLQQIIESLVQTVIRLQEVSCNTQDNQKGSNQKKRCSIWNALHIFAKVRPKLVWPYLSELCQLLKQVRRTTSSSSSTTSTTNSSSTESSITHANNTGASLKQTLSLNNDMAICMNHLCGTLNAGLAAAHGYSLEHRGIDLSQENLCDIANDLINLATNAPKKFIVDSAIQCLYRVSNFTKQFDAVQNMFSKAYNKVQLLTEQLKSINHQIHSKDIDSKRMMLFRMSYTTVVLCRYFELDDLLNRDLESQSKEVFNYLLDTTIYFAKHDVKDRMISNMNHLVHKDHNLLIQGPIHEFYIETLNLVNNEKHLSDVSGKTISLVIENISNFLKHNELKMMTDNANWKLRAQQESLKETQELSGSFGNIVAQKYVNVILDCCLVNRTEVRMAALNFICKVLSQGLVQPLNCVAHLIALQGDPEHTIRFKADSQLNELNNKYPTYLTMKAQIGMKFSYRLQNAVNSINKTGPNSTSVIVVTNKRIRGWVCSNNAATGAPTTGVAATANFHAINHHLYNLLRRHKQNWRSFLSALISFFDTEQNLSMKEMMFYVDQLSALPYQIQEEPMILIHKLDSQISVEGQTILRECKDVLKRFVSKHHADRMYREGEISSNELNQILKCLIPQTSIDLINLHPSGSLEDARSRLCLANKASKRVRLLISLREYLAKIYGISENKILNYHQNQNSKNWDKPVCRSVNAVVFEAPAICTQEIPNLSLLSKHIPNTTQLQPYYEAMTKLLNDILKFREALLSIGTPESTNNDDSIEDQKCVEPVKQPEVDSNPLPELNKTKKISNTIPEKSKREINGDNGKKIQNVPNLSAHKTVTHETISESTIKHSPPHSNRVAVSRSPSPSKTSVSSSVSSSSTLAEHPALSSTSKSSRHIIKQHHNENDDDDDDEYVPNKKRKIMSSSTDKIKKSTKSTPNLLYNSLSATTTPNKRRFHAPDKEIPNNSSSKNTPKSQFTNSISEKQHSTIPSYHQKQPVKNPFDMKSETKHTKQSTPHSSTHKTPHHHSSKHPPVVQPRLTALPSDFIGAPKTSSNNKQQTTSSSTSHDTNKSFKHSTNLFNHYSDHPPPPKKAFYKSSVKTMPNPHSHSNLQKRTAQTPIRPLKKPKKKRRIVSTSSDSDDNWDSTAS